MKHILSFNLRDITDIQTINFIVSIGYKETGSKFSVNFCGSKGYLNHFEISSENCHMHGANRICIPSYTNKNGSLKSKIINIYFSKKDGVLLTPISILQLAKF